MKPFTTLRRQISGILAAAALAVLSLASSVPTAIQAVAVSAAPVVSSIAPVAIPAAIGAVSVIASTPAHATLSYATTLRTADMTNVITGAGGTGGKLLFYNGCTVPSGVSSATGCTLLATLSYPSGPIGTASGGVLTFDTSPTQTNTSHVAGTPTFIDVTNSGGTVQLRMTVCGSAPCWTFPNPIVNGQNISVVGMTLTAGNP
jgi:hypothetical protein